MRIASVSYRWRSLTGADISAALQALAAAWGVDASRINMKLSWEDDEGDRKERKPSDAADAATFSENDRSLSLSTSLGIQKVFYVSLSVLGGTITAHLNCPDDRLFEKTAKALKTSLGLESLDDVSGVIDQSIVDDELWEQVAHLVREEQWAQVASQTAIFVENRVRELASRSLDEYGKRLMNAVFNPGGDIFPLGKTSGERQGWHQFAMGFTLALRNVDTHRIQNRADLRRYAFGVLGAGSLLLTQLRHQYEDKLHTREASGGPREQDRAG